MGSMNSSCSLMIFLIIGAAFLTLNPVAAKLDWRTCGSSLPKACGEVIGQRVKSNKGSPVSDDCCVALVKIGKPCHDAFTRVWTERDPPILVFCLLSKQWKLKYEKKILWYYDSIISRFMQEHIKSHNYKGRTYMTVKRSEKVWNDCVEVAKFVFPRAEAPESS